MPTSAAVVSIKTTRAVVKDLRMGAGCFSMIARRDGIDGHALCCRQDAGQALTQLLRRFACCLMIGPQNGYDMPWLLRSVGAMTLVTCLFASATPLRAQGVEITPSGGYRFGGDFFELITGQPVDTDGAPTVGAVVDIPIGEGLQFEALFTRQKSHVTTASGPLGVPTRWTITVDHWQGGALQEYADGDVRPFATGMFGLTRYAGEGDSEMRFTIGAGGGVKLFPSSAFGIRLNGQVSATFVHTDATVLGCGGRTCIVNFDADIVWQIEFSAGLIVRVR